MPGWVQNLVQILFVLFVILGPAIGALRKHLAKEAEKRRRQEQARRMQAEMLRTGRPAVEQTLTGRTDTHPPSVSPQVANEMDAKRRLQELAHRRRLELEQLARQAQARPAARPVQTPRSVPTGQSTPPTYAGPNGRPTLPPRSAQKRAAQQQRAGKPPSPSPTRGPQDRRGQAPASRPERAPPHPAPDQYEIGAGHTHGSAGEPAEGESIVHRLVSDVVAARAAQNLRPGIGAGEFASITPADLRRAIVLRELLGPPAALRDPTATGQDNTSPI